MFADDLIIVSTTQKGLQDSLDKLCEYCRKWDLKVNLAETKCVVFSRGRCKLDSKFVFDKKEVEYANSFKYLGVSIDHRGNFSPTMKDLSTKATNAIFALKQEVNFKYLSVKAKLTLFDHLIAPILLYGSEIWEPYINQNSAKWDAGEIEKVHLSFLKSILGVNRSTANVLVRGELGRYSLKEKCLIRNINYTKYLNSKDHKDLVKQAFNYEISKSEIRPTILSSIGEFSQKIDELEGNPSIFLNCRKEKQESILTAVPILNGKKILITRQSQTHIECSKTSLNWKYI